MRNKRITAEAATTAIVSEPAGPLMWVVAAASGGCRIHGVAYSGSKMKLPGWSHPVVVDLQGMESAETIPLLTEHQNHVSSRIGVVRPSIESRLLRIEGEILAKTDEATAIVDQAKAGAGWELSIGADPVEKELVTGSRMVNGQMHTGPFILVKKSVLREVSVVALGADAATRMNVAAKFSLFGGTDMRFEEWLKAKNLDAATMDEKTIAAQRLLYDAEVKAGTVTPPAAAEPPKVAAAAPVLDVQAKMQEFRDAQAAEELRIAAVRKVCGTGHGEIAAKAIKEGWDEQRTKDAVEVADIRAARPAHPGIITGGGLPSTIGKETIEAALCLRHNVGDSKFLMAQYGQETLNAADKLRRLPLTRIMEIAAARAGIPIPLDVRSDEFIRAAFSTSELSGIVGNVANKALAAAFLAVNAVIPRIAAKRSHGNFLSHTVYSLAVNGDLELVGPDGELKHLSMSEENWTRAVDTRGALLTITRKDIVNDELGAFVDNGARLGRKAAIAREKAGFTLLNATGAGSSFFTSARNNYISGSTTALSNDAAIASALQKFRDQTGPDGDPVMIEPKLLLVPTALEADALRLFNSEFLIVTGLASQSAKSTQPQNNIYRGRFTPLVSEWLSKSALTGYSSTAWYLLAEPNDVPVMEIAYLNGVDTPVVEYFGLSQDVNTLGVTWRCYFDFGVALAEYRAGVKSKGAA